MTRGRTKKIPRDVSHSAPNCGFDATLLVTGFPHSRSLSSAHAICVSNESKDLGELERTKGGERKMHLQHPPHGVHHLSPSSSSGSSLLRLHFIIGLRFKRIEIESRTVSVQESRHYLSQHLCEVQHNKSTYMLPHKPQHPGFKWLMVLFLPCPA